MLAVGLGPEKASEAIRDAGMGERVRVAAINSPYSVTLSGDADAIEELRYRLNLEGTFKRQLRTGGLAYHSHHMLPLGLKYAAVVEEGIRRVEELLILAGVQKYPVVPWVSS